MKRKILKTFFNAMNEMIDTKAILKGRDFDIKMEHYEPRKTKKNNK
jgi:hypothetical protein